VLLTGSIWPEADRHFTFHFNPVKVLKGTIQLGKRAALPRKIMVVVQFTVQVRSSSVHDHFTSK